MMVGLVLATIAITGVQCACDPSLTLSDGPVVGVCNTTLPNIAFRSFLGIPYGADTSGANRFMPPQPPAKWSTPLKAHAFGPGCPQTDHNPDVPTLQSEDCLSINVWTPFDAKAGDNLPVTLWIYGTRRTTPYIFYTPQQHTAHRTALQQHTARRTALQQLTTTHTTTHRTPQHTTTH